MFSYLLLVSVNYDTDMVHADSDTKNVRFIGLRYADPGRSEVTNHAT